MDKKKRRSESIYPKRWLSCFKAGHRKASKEFIDDELAHRLLSRVVASNYTDKEAIDALDFLHKLNSEYYKNVIKKGDRKALHRTKKMRRDCYARENARNRDIMSVERHKVESLERELSPADDSFYSEAFLYSHGALEGHEDIIIELLDGKYLAQAPEDIEN